MWNSNLPGEQYVLVTAEPLTEPHGVGLLILLRTSCNVLEVSSLTNVLNDLLP